MFKFWKKDKISTSLTDTFIGEGTIVEGAIRSAGSVRVEGQLRGDIFCEGDVVLGESAFAISNITARNAFLAGQVTGNVRISGKLTITSTGKLYGDMDAATLEIEEGGVFQGNSAMDKGEPVVSPIERRSGRDRRAANDPNWNGEERRSGYDRRDKNEPAGSGPLIKKISYRAPEKKDEAETGPEAAEHQAADDTQAFANPLRENGRAFMQNMNAGRKQDKLGEGVSDEERAALGVPGQAAGPAAKQHAAALAETAAASEAAVDELWEDAASAVVGATIVAEAKVVAEEALTAVDETPASVAADAEVGSLGGELGDTSGSAIAAVAAAAEELPATGLAEIAVSSYSERSVGTFETDAAAVSVGVEMAGAKASSGFAVGRFEDETVAVDYTADDWAENKASNVNERSVDGLEQDASAVSAAAVAAPVTAMPLGSLEGAELAGMAAAELDAKGSEEGSEAVAAIEAGIASDAASGSDTDAPIALAGEGKGGWTIFEPLRDGQGERPSEQTAVAGDSDTSVWNSASGFGINVGKPHAGVAATAAPLTNAASGEPVRASGSAYAFGFEQRAHAGGGEHAGQGDQSQRSQPANNRNAEEAAALLRNW
ncbi:polymer-forming cytoskeletal protein [Paenibacillus lycopersici]|uniref:Polymer-forming cytoskeletal protein n=1 Tax=Paenibacillus lycopersici TaxID=2704462 RepID=A0A6C0FUZ7_9BACL|nr:polymer-forming cytoskeletal protein [Paenibacillus lycopersici]QHT59301.1 polymer-forming cytoskeletal protein [Paenibacillus lycopersici]